MTITDYFGAILAIIIFLLLAGAYYYAFTPSNKDKFEDMRNFVNEE
jgi:cbb3-type cytochrome oxidase subunit 3